MRSLKEQIPVIEKQWYAVKCKYRCEKSLTTEFNQLGIVAYVPILTKVRRYTSRSKTSTVALIPSHIFVQINRSSYLPILRHHHVYGFLHFSGVIHPIPEHEMMIMKRVVGAPDVSLTEVSEYNIGDEVEIIGGEMTGLRGYLVEEANHNFKIELSSIGMGLKINVDPQHLMKIGSNKKVA